MSRPSVLDLLFAEALAAGMSRMTDEADKAPPPENFFVLPADPEAWRKLYVTCMKENLVMCVEVTKEAPHVPSLNVHPHFLNLARKVPNIPFIQVKTGLFRSFDKVREDLGGVETAPTLVIAFFDENGVRIKQVEGEDKIKFGISLGIIENTIKEFLEKRAKIKMAEKMSEHFTELLLGDLEKRKQRQEYEERLKKEARDLEERLKENEQQRKEEEEKQKKMEDDKRRKMNELHAMDLQTAKISHIKTKMDDLKISYVGATTREDLLQQIKKAIPSVKYSEASSDSGDLLLNYKTTDRHTEDYALHAASNTGTTYKESENLEETDRIGHQPTATQDELLETRMLYACTLHDMDILGKVAMKEEGVVVRTKCIKPGIPNPMRVYAMKVIANVHETNTLSKVQADFKNEYDILSSLPKHKNIIQLFAFFYDRPKAYQPLSYLPDGIALCLLMENLSQNMQDHIDGLSMGQGPKAIRYLRWLKDVVCGLVFLFQNHVVHRDMKLDNLLLATGDSVKISDFGLAIRLDSGMKLPFSFVIPRGGNEAHLSPEILNTRAKPGSTLNYSKQPVWEAGVLAYELAGHKSPFKRSSIDQRAYNVSSLPPLVTTWSQSSSDHESLPSPLTSLVHSMLEYSPNDRPSIESVYKTLATIILD